LEGRPSREAKVRRSSWQYQTMLMAFLLSPYTLRLLLCRIMKSPSLLKQLSPPRVLSLMKNQEHLLGDKAYDSDPLDERLAMEYGIEMISPHRGGWRRKRPKKTQDGRPLRRYKRSWKIERLFAWLQNLHHILVRYEYHAENYLGFVQLGCIMILLRRCL
jgi:transposase